MNFKLNALVAAAMMAASVPAFAAMSDATSGNGELLVNLRFYTGDNNSGGDDISAVFDLGTTMNDFLANKNVAGYTQSWNLAAANYGTAWNDVIAFAGVNTAAIEYNVIALDNTNANTAGGSRYLTTLDVVTFPALSNQNTNLLSDMNGYVTSNNSRGTHATEANGASTATSNDTGTVYFGKALGTADGDTWVTRLGSADTTKTLSTAQNFWFLTTSSTSTTGAATKQAFGYDLDGNGSIGTGEFGEWSFNGSVLTFANPAPVPEASTYGMMLAGLGLVGFMARRRMNRAA